MLIGKGLLLNVAPASNETWDSQGGVVVFEGWAIFGRSTIITPAHIVLLGVTSIM